MRQGDRSHHVLLRQQSLLLTQAEGLAAMEKIAVGLRAAIA